MKFKIKKPTRLEDLPNGSLFLTLDKKTMGFKSEYRTDQGAIEAYIVGSGEMFWGGTSDPNVQKNIWVYELKRK